LIIVLIFLAILTCYGLRAKLEAFDNLAM